ncbi:hypothetical protein CHARACLAT_011706, partial [Characodon lateralis]|nr:hypothetical protein [Characodon lateralis]
TVSNDISKALELFKTGHEYLVESDCYIRTQIATLDMPSEQIFANLQTILTDVCSHRPTSLGMFTRTIKHTLDLLNSPSTQSAAADVHLAAVWAAGLDGITHC